MLASAMEQEMRNHLCQCAEAFAAARQLELATVGRLAAGDWRFFDRVRDDAKTFTARKYDEVIGWFSENWPSGEEWPSEVKRPETERAAS